MPTLSEPQILADVLDNTRQMTRFYLQQVAEVDKGKSFTVGDFQTNSIHWIVAHLAWAEDYLILRGVGNQGLQIPWFEYFCIGSESPDLKFYPPYQETVETGNQVHDKALEIIRDIPTEVLDEANHLGLKFSFGNSKRIMIYHCIRHEGIHCGHLSWLARMHGKKIV